ncbi:MAG: serpin family protein [bacterium]
MKKQKGFILPLILVIVVLVVMGGFVYVKNNKGKNVNNFPVLSDSISTSTEEVSSETTSGVKRSDGVTSDNTSTLVSSNIGSVTSESPKKIPSSHNSFGIDLLKLIKVDEGTDNVFISPSSIALALSMVYNGAEGNTKTAMQKILYFKNIDTSSVNKESLGLINSLKNADSKIALSIANSIWARSGVQFNANFVPTIKSYYNAESSILDFNNPSSVKTINSWVSKNTNGKISSIISSIPSSMVMYVINAVYFKGSWTKAFDKKLTENKDFTNANGSSVKIPFMERAGTMPYFETNDPAVGDFQSVELSYGINNRITMDVFLPKDINKFVTGVTPEKLNGWLGSYLNKKGDLIIPKFKIEYEKQLNSALTKLGMGVAFSDSADLSGIGKSLKISEVKHKSYIDVNEEGTEAAAVTSVGVATAAAPREPEDRFYMEVNHPFFFVIRDKQTSEILFMGVIQNLK